jgi:hypothetical protein
LSVVRRLRLFPDNRDQRTDNFFQLLLVVSLFSVGGQGGLPGWKKDAWRKLMAGVSLVPPEKRDDDEGRRRLKHSIYNPANRVFSQRR